MLSLDDVLSIRHPEPPAWSPDASCLAFVYIVDGVRELWTADAAPSAAPPRRVSAAGLAVSASGWLADGRLVYASETRLYAAGPEGPDGTPAADLLVDGQAAIRGLACAPAGAALALVRSDGSVLRVEEGMRLREPALPGKATSLVWSPRGTRLAVGILRQGETAIVVQDSESSASVWQSGGGQSCVGPLFVGEGRLTFVRESGDSTWYEFVLVDLETGAERVMERVESAKGLSFAVEPAAAPDGNAVAYTVPVDGWLHVVVHDLSAGTRTVALPGAHEDLGHEAEQAAFSPDGRSLVFSTSRAALQQRQIWRYDLATGRAYALTDERGTHTDPAWSPDGASIACLFGGPWHSQEVTVLAARDGSAKRRLTRSMPPAWTKEAIVEPRHVLLTSADGMAIHADVWLPKAPPAGAGRVPGLVYVHGGPTRQMRDGWHPMHPYAVFYAYNQYLVDRGYAVISVDYRGGTGYGVDYEQANHLAMASRDMDDCIAAAAHLAALPEVDPARLAIWGLSYGGYMTLAALTKRPEVFALGINIAGLWDMEQWLAWAGTRYAGHAPYFARRLGGALPQGDAEAHRQASPRNFVANLRGPLLNLMGTADANVDFAQLDQIVRDCTGSGRNFAALYYPDETHMFTRRTTWEDAFGRIEAAFERYLRCDPADRPAAMI